MIINKSVIIGAMSVFIYILPWALFTGSFLSDLFLSLSSLIFLVLSIRKKMWKYYCNKFFIFFIIFYVYIVLRSFLSVDVFFSLESSLFYFRYILFSLSIWFLIDENKNFLKYFCTSLLLAFIFLILAGLYQYLTIDASDSINRLNLFFNEKKTLGAYLARLSPLLFALIYINYDTKKALIISSLLLVSLDVLIYLSGERTAIGQLVLITIMIIVMLNQFRIIRILTFIISLIIIIFISIMDPSVKKSNIDRTITQMNLDSSSENLILFSTEHDKIYRDSLVIFTENPIFGIGTKLYRVYCNKGRYDINPLVCSTHPHNSYIQLLVETGLIGATFMVLLLLYFIGKVLKNLRANYLKKKPIYNNYQLLLIISFFITLFPFLPSMNLFNNWINIIYFLPVGFFLHSMYANQEKIYDNQKKLIR